MSHRRTHPWPWIALALLFAAPPSATLAADARAPKPVKVKKNEAYVAPDFASYGVVTIGLAPVSSIDHVEENEKLFRQALEYAFGSLGGYKFQGASFFMDGIRKGGAVDALAAIEKAGQDGLRADTASVNLVRAKCSVQAVLFSRLSTWQRLVVDPSTRGQSFTQVGGDFALVSLKDGAVLWRGSFLEKGDGPYNDPNAGETTVRDVSGNAVAKTAQLEPPSFREVLEKLANRVVATVPKAPAPAPAAKSAP